MSKPQFLYLVWAILNPEFVQHVWAILSSYTLYGQSSVCTPCMGNP